MSGGNVEATQTVDAFATADGYSVGTSPVEATPFDAIVAWAQDESVEPGDLSDGDTVVVQARKFVPGPVRGQWSNVAQEAVDRVMADFGGAYNDTDGLRFPRYYAVRRVIIEALDDLTRDMPVTMCGSDAVADCRYTREQVAEMLREAGVWK